MTQEEKKLLTIAISGYYPYGLICKVGRYKRQIVEVGDGCVSINDSTPSDKHFYLSSYGFDKWTVKPYLRSMSTMTEEERMEFIKLFDKWHDDELFDYIEEGVEFSIWKHKGISAVIFDWLNKKMFDYRGLIPMGLAYEATEDMYD